MLITSYQQAAPAKALVMGNSGAGKTCLVFGLLRAGYRVAILDLDQKLRPLATLINHFRPDLAANVDIAVFGEQYQTVGGEIRHARRPMTWESLLGLLDNWETDSHRLGPVSGWGPGVVLVVDSLWPLGQSVLDIAQATSNRKDAYGAAYGDAYQRLDRFFERLRSNVDTPCHVVVMAHMQMQETQEAGAKMVPVLPGRQFGPRLGRSFDIVLHAEARSDLARSWADGTPASQRIVWTVPTPLVDVKVPALGLPAAIPNEVALPYIFEKVRGVPGPSGSVEGVAQTLVDQLPFLAPAPNMVMVRQSEQFRRS